MNQSLDEQIKVIEEATGHSVFGGSSLPRIVKCPASVQESLSAPLKPESPYAAKGTMLHGIMEKAMKNKHPREYLLSLDLDIEDTVLCLDAAEYVQSVVALHPSGDFDIEFEALGNLSSYGLPEVYGTKDVVIRSANRTDVIDYKFGYGVAVYAKENYQLVTYLAMAVPFEENPPHNVNLHVHICQPPLNIYDDWELDYNKMYHMVLGDVTDAIMEARSANPSYHPSESACRFCPANMRCKPRHRWLSEQAKMIQRMSRDPAGVSNEDWAKFLDGWEALKSAASQVEKHAMSEIMAGREFKGYKLVAGRANRKFKDEEKGKAYIKEVLGNKAYASKEPPLVSLAQAEKLAPELKQDEFWKDLVYKPDGTPKLKKVTDKGKAMEFGARALINDMLSKN